MIKWIISCCFFHRIWAVYDPKQYSGSWNGEQNLQVWLFIMSGVWYCRSELKTWVRVWDYRMNCISYPQKIKDHIPRADMSTIILQWSPEKEGQGMKIKIINTTFSSSTFGHTIWKSYKNLRRKTSNNLFELKQINFQHRTGE